MRKEAEYTKCEHDWKVIYSDEDGSVMQCQSCKEWADEDAISERKVKSRKAVTA